MIEYPNGKDVKIIVKDNSLISFDGLFYTKGDYNSPEQIHEKDKINEMLHEGFQIRVQTPLICNIFPAECFLYFEYVDGIQIFNNMIVVEV